MNAATPFRGRPVCCLLLLLGSGCAFGPRQPVSACWQIEDQVARLVYDPSPGRLTVSTRLTLVNRGRTPLSTIWLRLCVEPDVALVTVRDRAGRAVTARRAIPGQLQLDIPRTVAPGMPVHLSLDYSVVASASPTAGIVRAGEWLTIKEDAGILPVTSLDPPPFHLEVTCRAPTGTTGVIHGAFEPRDGQDDQTTRFVRRRARGRLAGIFGPLRRVRTGTRRNELMMWVGPDTPPSRCQDLGRLLTLIDRSLAEQLGQAADHEPITIIEQPGPDALAADRCLMIPSPWLMPSTGRFEAAAALEIGCLLARQHLTDRGPRPLAGDLIDGVAAFLTVRSLRRAGQEELAREVQARLSAASRAWMTEALPARPTDRALAALLLMTDDLISPPGQSLLTETLKDRRAAQVAERAEIPVAARPSPQSIAWDEFRDALETDSAARSHRAILDWLEHPSPLTLHYAWSASTEPGGTRTVLFARADPPIPLRAELLLWSPGNRRLETVAIDVTQPDIQISTPFMPEWLELDPDRLFPGIVVPDADPSGSRERGARRLQACMDRMQWGRQPRIESLRVGSAPRLDWTRDRGLWLTRPDTTATRLTSLGLSVLAEALEGAHEILALRDRPLGGQRLSQLEILVDRRPRARLGIDPDTGRLATILLVDPEGHRQAYLELERFVEDRGMLRPSRIRLASPLLDDAVVIDAQATPPAGTRR